MSSFFKTVDAFVASSEGDHSIRKILIANNGIGAIKAIRSIRKWAYETFGNERIVSLSIIVLLLLLMNHIYLRTYSLINLYV